MAAEKKRLRVLFLCTGNSCRSQMAEGWARYLKGDSIEPYSAGTVPQTLNPLAVKVMKEAGVDISQHVSKHLESLKDRQFDFIVTVCGSAKGSCPLFSRDTRTFHAGFDDPPRLASGVKTEEEALQHYRRVRDEIRDFIEKLPEALYE